MSTVSLPPIYLSTPPAWSTIGLLHIFHSIFLSVCPTSLSPFLFLQSNMSLFMSSYSVFLSPVFLFLRVRLDVSLAPVSFHPVVSPSLCLSVALSLRQFVSLPLHLPLFLSTRLSPSLSVSLPFYPSDSFYFCLSPSTSVFVNLHLSLSLFICLPPSPSVSLSLTCIKFCLDKDRWITVETGGPTSVHFCKFTCVPLSFTSTLYHAPGGWEGGVAGGGAGQLRHQQAEEHLCHAVSLSLSIALSRRFLLLSRGFTKPDRQSLFIQICFNLNKGSFLTFPQC